MELLVLALVMSHWCFYKIGKSIERARHVLCEAREIGRGDGEPR